MNSTETELDFSEGSGSLSETETLIDQDSIIEADGRSDMETSFNQNFSGGVLMSDGKRRPWGYLYKQNEGHFGSNKADEISKDTVMTKEQRQWFREYKNNQRDSSDESNKANVRRDAATFCSHVDLSDHQTRRVMFHVADLEVNEFGQTSVEAVILALIAYVANVDDRWIQRESEFRELQESLEITSDKVKRVQRTVKERVGSDQ